jgi:hypothetical protein
MLGVDSLSFWDLRLLPLALLVLLMPVELIHRLALYLTVKAVLVLPSVRVAIGVCLLCF